MNVGKRQKDGKGTQGYQWMPRQFEPRKDGCMDPITTVSLQTGVINRWFPNGETHRSADERYSFRNYFSKREGTRGTETSQYPKEKKAYAILLVAASERGTA